MQIRTQLGYGEVCAIIRRVSADSYGGNVKPHNDSRALYSGGRGYAGRIDTVSSREAGARRSWSGRRTPAACWHAFRDIFRAILAEDTSAVIVTSMARYYGKDHKRIVTYVKGGGLSGEFEETYPHTANVNVGSMMSPAYMTELCDCEDYE
jgi:hypothetical protein